MAQIIVRKLDETVKRKLQRRAARHGRSMEEEIREILSNAVKSRGGARPKMLKDENRQRHGLGSAIAARFKGNGLDEPIQEFRGFPIESPTFD
jgi:plasmid stability protein